MNEKTAYRYKPYRNNEGYPDPTAYHAIRRCYGEQNRGYMPSVLLYSTERDSEERLLHDGSCYAIRKNCIPIAPQLICFRCFYAYCDNHRTVLRSKTDAERGNRTLWSCGQVVGKLWAACLSIAYP